VHVHATAARMYYVHVQAPPRRSAEGPVTQRLRCVLVAQTAVLEGPQGNLMHRLKGTTLSPPLLRPSPPPYHSAPFFIRAGAPLGHRDLMRERQRGNEHSPCATIGVSDASSPRQGECHAEYRAARTTVQCSPVRLAPQPRCGLCPRRRGVRQISARLRYHSQHPAAELPCSSPRLPLTHKPYPAARAISTDRLSLYI
jgi:hypothetical protein